MAEAALVIVGILLVVVGILAGGSIPFVGLGVLSLVAAGILQVMSSRRS
jgi:type II secretory pathway pseudopilin PulG